jgi:hypothetical protein
LKHSIEHLSKNLSADTFGIVWLTDSTLNYDTPGVYEFNYLLDGILLKRIAQNETLPVEQRKSNFFLGQSFGKPIFISHVLVEHKNDLKLSFNHLDTALPLIEEGSKIQIFNRSKNTANLNVLKEFTNKYKQLRFEILNI